MGINQFGQSLRHAWRGIRLAWRHEQNFRLQVGLGLFVVILILIFPVRKSEMLILLLLIFAVLALELLNSALEQFLDILKPRLQHQVGMVKDMLAAMVLVLSVAAAVIGGLIFYPYLVSLLS